MRLGWLPMDVRGHRRSSVFQGELIDSSLADAQCARDLLSGSLAVGTLLQKGTERCSDLRVRHRLSMSACVEHEDRLASARVLVELSQDLFGRSSIPSLMLFSELSTHGDLRLGVDHTDLTDHVMKIPRRTEVGVGAVREVAEARGALSGLLGDEAMKGQRFRRETRHRCGGQEGARAGDAQDRVTSQDRRAHQALSGVSDRGGARVAHQRDALAPRQELENTDGARRFIMGLMTHQRCRDPILREEPGGDPCVFTGHAIDLAKHADGSERDVLEVPDRRRHDIERAGFD